jgi:hypothetical protein
VLVVEQVVVHQQTGQEVQAAVEMQVLPALVEP